MADGPDLNGRGSFVLIDGASMTTKGTWAASEEDVPPFGCLNEKLVPKKVAFFNNWLLFLRYDFWYQPFHNVMIR